MRTALSILMILISVSVFGQKYHASALWNASGPVKEIKYSNTDYYNDNPVVKFKKNGKLAIRPIILWYGENGYPESYTWAIDKNGGVMSDSIAFDSQFKPLLFSYTYTLVGLNSQQELRFTYAPDSTFPESMTRKLILNKEGAYIEVEYKYSDYSTDENGNWIRRKVSMKATGADCTPNVESAEFVESRTITYHKLKNKN